MTHCFEKNKPYDLPDKDGFFGKYGGMFVPEPLIPVLRQLEADFLEAWNNEQFLDDLYAQLKDYVGRPSPLYFAKRLTDHFGKAKIYLKREDLNHTGAHKINNALGQVLLAKHLNKKRVIAETGAGQHGLATATAAALNGLECIIFMGEEDVNRQYVNVEKMKTLGATVRPVTRGGKGLADAVDEAIEFWAQNSEDTFYLLGSAVGPHPYPLIVRSFQSVVGCEIKKQILEKEGRLPDYLLGCIGGGSNLIGAAYSFIKTSTKIIGLEAGGKGIDTQENCASLTIGKEGILHGFRNLLIEDESGNLLEGYSISAGLDYPGVGPEHCYLKDAKLAEYYPVTDDEAIEGFRLLTKLEGIIPAVESSHALGYLPKLMPNTTKDEIVVVNLSGRGDKDVERLLDY